jgi:hypothetical protein
MKIYTADTYGGRIHEVEATESMPGIYVTVEASNWFGSVGETWPECESLSKDRDKVLRYLRRYMVKSMNDQMETLSSLNRKLKALK